MRNLIKKINLRNQKFKCHKSGDKDKRLNLTVDIHHELRNGATDNDISLLEKMIPENNEEVIELYKLYNGIKLYCNGNTSGLQIYPISDLKELNVEWKESISYYDEEDLYDFQKKGVAFGDISHSGNYFVLYKGKVYYSNHDGGDDTSLVESFKEFLSKIVENPAKFLYDMGCYTRYADGKTDGQWIPQEFIADED